MFLLVTFKLKAPPPSTEDKTIQHLSECPRLSFNATENVQRENILGAHKTDKPMNIYYNYCTALSAYAVNCEISPQSVI